MNLKVVTEQQEETKNQWWIKLKVGKKLAETNLAHVDLVKNLSIAVVLYKI